MSNKEQLIEILESLKNLKDSDLMCHHVMLGDVRIYVHEADYLNVKNVTKWYFTIEYKGISFVSNEGDFENFFEDIDLTPWFDGVRENIKPSLKSESENDKYDGRK